MSLDGSVSRLLYGCFGTLERGYAVMMIRACVDECSTHNDPNSPMLMYGCVSSLPKWGLFDDEWKKTLRKFRVPYAHAKSLIETDHPYDDGTWTKEKKLKFTTRLDKVIRRRIDFCFATVLQQEDFDNYRQHREMNSVLDSKYGLSVRVALSFLHQRCQLFYDDPKPEIYVVYENGHPNSGAFPDLFRRMGNELDPCFIKSVVPVRKGDCTGTQAADMNAYAVLQMDEKGVPRYTEVKSEEEIRKFSHEKTPERPFPVYRLPISAEVLTDLRDAIILSKPKLTRAYGHLLSGRRDEQPS